MTATDTETKPSDTPTVRQLGTVLRTVFSVDAGIVPPPLARVSAKGLPIGRTLTTGLRLDDARLSRHHATVKRGSDGTLLLIDEGSKNGSFVNGERVSERPLALGDVISLGDTCLVVCSEPEHELEPHAFGLTGHSAATLEVCAQIRRFGKTRRSTLLSGETGCGKEIVARALHVESGAVGAFVAINCAAVPEHLFESQFFGHRSGSFTGAAAHDGFFRAAEGGTLFLDEIGELPLTQQPKLLRALQERNVIPLGALKPIPCDVRIVAATNRDLREQVARGQFRGDLLARLFEDEITLQPLRKRPEDIIELFIQALPDPRQRLTHALAEALLRYDWPFNVRELRAVASNVARDAQPDEQLGVHGFQQRLRGGQSHSPQGRSTPPPALDRAPPEQEPEHKLVVDALIASGWNQSRAAKMLGISRNTLITRLERYQIKRPQLPRSK